MNKTAKSENADYLFRALAKLETSEERKAFFEDLCSPKELETMAQRLCIAKLLKEGHVYNDIVEKTGASTATVSRVNRSLQLGNDGYSIVFDRLNKS